MWDRNEKSILIVEDNVWEPNTLTGYSYLGDVAKVGGVPVEKFIDPFLIGLCG